MGTSSNVPNHGGGTIFATDANGNAIGLLGPNGSIHKANLSNVLTAGPPDGNRIVTANSTQYTYHIQQELESNVSAIRLLIPNGDTSTIAGVKASVAFGEVLGAHGDADVITPSGAWSAVTFSGSATVTLAAGTSGSLPSWTASDWIKIPSVPRTDGGERPVMHIRILSSGPISRISLNDFDDNQIIGSVPRVYRQRRQAVDGITTPANFTSNTWNDACHTALVQYMTDVPGLCVAGFGDSIMSGTGATVRGNAWGLRGCTAVSSPEYPVQWLNVGQASSAGDTWESKMSGLFTAMGTAYAPNVVLAPIGGPNSASNTLDATEVNTMRGDMALMRRTAKTLAPDALLIPVTWLPENAASNDYGSTDSLRRDYNASVKAGRELIADVDSVLAGTMDVDGQVEYLAGSTTDGLHPNDTGHELLGAYLATVLQRIY